MEYCHWYSQQIGHQTWICIFCHPQGPRVSQNLCNVDAKPAYIWAQMGRRGNMHASFAETSWRRGFHAVECHRQWNMEEPSWTYKQMSMHGIETYHHSGQRNSKVCLLLAKWCWCCFRTLMGLSLSITGIVDRWSVVHLNVVCLKRSWNLLFTVNAEECIVLHHDKAEPHMTEVIVEMIWKLKFKLPAHPTYSLNLSLSDYHIFRPLKDVLQWHWFAYDEMWMLCIYGFTHIWKHSSQMASGN